MWNGPNCKLLRHLWVLVYIEFKQFDFPIQFCQNLVQDRIHSLTRPAPIGIEIHQYWFLALADLVFQILLWHSRK